MKIVVAEEVPRKVIEENFEFEIRMKFPKIINDAYFWAHRLIENTATLNWIRGNSLLPNIKNIAVEYFLVQEIKNGKLPLQWRINYTSNRSASFIEIFNDSLLLHVNQVQNKKCIGRPAFCRDQHLEHFQTYFNIEPEKNVVNFVKDKQRYFQLNHGYQSREPLFINLGIPGSNRKWIDNINILEEFASIEGRFPKSKPENIEELNLEEFQRYAEGMGNNGNKEFGS